MRTLDSRRKVLPAAPCPNEAVLCDGLGVVAVAEGCQREAENAGPVSRHIASKSGAAWDFSGIGLASAVGCIRPCRRRLPAGS